MLKRKSFYIVMTIVGGCLTGMALLFHFAFEMPKIAAAVCVGIGTALLGVGIPNLIMKHCEAVEPELMKRNRIELRDERNTMIRNKAKAKAGDITQWFIMGIAYITIIVEAPLWVIVAVVSVFMLKNILESFFLVKYQKEL